MIWTLAVVAAAVRVADHFECHESDSRLLIPICKDRSDEVGILTSLIEQKEWTLRKLSANGQHYGVKPKLLECLVIPGVTRDATVWDGHLRSSHTQSLFYARLQCEEGLALLVNCNSKDEHDALLPNCGTADYRGDTPFLRSFDNLPWIEQRLKETSFLWLNPVITRVKVEPSWIGCRKIQIVGRVASVSIDGNFLLIGDDGLASETGLIGAKGGEVTIYSREPVECKVSISLTDTLIDQLLGNKETAWRLWQTACIAAMIQSFLSMAVIAVCILWHRYGWAAFVACAWMFLCVRPFAPNRIRPKYTLKWHLLALYAIGVVHPIPLVYDLLCILSFPWMAPLLFPASYLHSFSWIRQLWWAWQEGPRGSLITYLTWIWRGVPDAPLEWPWLPATCILIAAHTDPMALIPLCFY